MRAELKSYDVTNLPELERLAEEVQRTNEPRVLRRNGENLAILYPLRPSAQRPSGRGPTKADIEAFRSSAGGWKDVDTDQLKNDIYCDRRSSDRPPIEL